MKLRKGLIKNKIVIIGWTTFILSNLINNISNIALGISVKAVISYMECQTPIAGPGQEHKCIIDKAIQRYGDGLMPCRDFGDLPLENYEIVRTLDIYGYYDEIGWPGPPDTPRHEYIATIELCRPPKNCYKKKNLAPGDAPYSVESRCFTALAENDTDNYNATVPCNKDCESGLTIGYGYDMKKRKAKKIIIDLKFIGLKQEAADLYSRAAGLKGDEAKKFIREHTKNQNPNENLADIDREKAWRLFQKDYDYHEDDIQRILFTYGNHAEDFKRTNPSDKELTELARQRNSTRSIIWSELQEQHKKNLQDFEKDEWIKIDERMREVLVDLRFQGVVTYKDTDLFKYFENNDLDGFREQFKITFRKDGNKNSAAKEGSRRFCLRLKKLESGRASDYVECSP